MDDQAAKSPKRRWDLRPVLREARDLAVYYLVRVIICVIQILPLSYCQRMCEGLAWFFGSVLKIRHKVVQENLKHALPELTSVERLEIERGMWLHLFQMICEIALAGRKIHETNWRQYYHITNRRALVQSFIQPRALVAVTAHFGNFAMCGYISGLLGFPTHTIARPLDNKYLHDFLMKFRGATGQYVLPTKGSAEEALQVVEAGETLALLGDHYGGKKGCWVDFFHRKASCHKAIALFSLANEIPLAVVYTLRRGGLMEFELRCVDTFDPAESDGQLDTVPDLTQWYNRHIEDSVLMAPEQYWWLHRRWKDGRKQRKKAKVPQTDKGKVDDSRDAAA